MGNRKLFILLAIASAVFLFANCFKKNKMSDPRGEEYAGSEKCAGCHPGITSSYRHTAHFLSTAIAGSNVIMGSFSRDSNKLIVNDSTTIVMEKKDSGFYQVLYVKDQPVLSRRFDLVMGSVKGQTYLSWFEQDMYQLPVSYITALNRWSSSPGYALEDLNFTRTITKDCFECHSSYVKRDKHGMVDYRRHANTWVFNIDCERCHGPAATHVLFHEAHPEERKSKFIVPFALLGRQQRIDLCAVCHSGNNNILLKSRFGYKMGDSLKSYMIPIRSGDELDVHGNQTQLLSQSKCFTMSPIECTTCHDPHKTERNNIQDFNARCQTCHTEKEHFCSFATESNKSFIVSNCTRCHMPEQPSLAIKVQAEPNSTRAIPTMVVNHRIAIYPEVTDKMLKN